MPEINEEISLLAALKDGRFEASLITTFNATLPFYEEVVLRRLKAAGSNDNVVLMDSVQCARSWATPSLRPRIAGSSYTLIPVVAPGAFHPKICLLAGRKRCVLLIGSHNVTLSGFGFNREVTTLIDVRPDSDAAHRLVLSHAWSLIREWLRTQKELVAPSVIDAALRIGRLIPAAGDAGSQVSDIRLLGQSREGPSLLDQLERSVPVPPKQVVVTGAFFDTKHAFLRKLEAQWPGTRIRVIIDPATVELGARPSGLRAQFVDAREIWPDKSDRYLHAKALLLDFGGSHTVVAGSANPSGPAWLAGGRHNFEAMLVRPGVAPGSSVFASDLALAFSARAMDEAELRAIPITRRDDENDPSEQGVPVRVAALPAGATSIAIPASDSRGLADVVMHLADGTRTDRTPIGRSTDGHAIIDLGPSADTVRWLELSGGGRLLRVIIHHEAALERSSSPSSRSALRDALAGLDFSGASIQGLIANIEKAIFDDPDQVIASPARTGPHTAPSQLPGAAARPASLGAHIGEGAGGKNRMKPRLLQHGSVHEVLDALFYRLGQGLSSSPPSGNDRTPVSEEEMVGNQDEGAAEEPAVPPQLAEILALRTRLRRIVGRMIRQLKLARDESKAELRASRARSAVVQLVAVLSLVREFRRMRHLPQWRRMGGFIDPEHRQDLLFQAMTILYGREKGIAALVHDSVGEGDEPAELGQVRTLLAWLAWDLGHSLLKRIDPLAPKSAREDLVRAYSYIYELMPGIVSDDEDTAHLASSVRMTAKPTADEGARGEEWLAHHHLKGLEVATAPPRAYDDREGLKAGDLMRLPTSPSPQLRVVIEVTSQQVRLTGLDSECLFERFAWKRHEHLAVQR